MQCTTVVAIDMDGRRGRPCWCILGAATAAVAVEPEPTPSVTGVTAGPDDHGRAARTHGTPRTRLRGPGGCRCADADRHAQRHGHDADRGAGGAGAGRRAWTTTAWTAADGTWSMELPAGSITSPVTHYTVAVLPPDGCRA